MVGAEGLFLTRTDALCNALTLLLGGIAWTGLLVFFAGRSLRGRQRCLQFVIPSTLGIAAIAVLGDGIAVVGVFPLAVATLVAHLHYRRQTKGSWAAEAE